MSDKVRRKSVVYDVVVTVMRHVESTWTIAQN